MNSVVLDVLKTVDERIDQNYTSGQLFEVLDKMLYRAVEPLILHTRYVDRVLSIVLAWYAQNHRRRISHNSKARLAAFVIAFLSETDGKKRVLLYRRMRLERNITFFIVNNWLAIVEPWKRLHVSACRGEVHRQLEQELMLQCCVTNPGKLWGTICTAQYWTTVAADFRDQMAEKYMRMVMLEAQSHWANQRENNPHLSLDLDELAQNFMLSVLKAIDKFDERQGTLTAYILNWLKNAKISQQYRGEYGVAYTIPHSKKTSIARDGDTGTRNLSVGLDDENVQNVADERNIESVLSQRQELHRVREVAKFSDVQGIGRLLLGIPEVLTDKELQLLRDEEARVLRVGERGGTCNRTGCRTPGATWFNHGTSRWYCATCARLINEAHVEDPVVKKLGHPLCTLEKP